jgi:hypothetical protein
VSLGFLQQSIRNKKTRINQRTFINTQIMQESI